MVVRVEAMTRSSSTTRHVRSSLGSHLSVHHPRQPGCSASPTAARMQCITHGSLDGHNGTQERSHFLSPGRFGYSTFAYPVRYSYKRDGRTSLFRPYHSSFTLWNPAAFTETRLECCYRRAAKLGVASADPVFHEILRWFPNFLPQASCQSKDIPQNAPTP
jgi:hypothetical protein